ncbi:hypothetical protein MM300_09400 [Evansella sp. LMS18]|uniref:hypothetical protein n=1 Tax=Evansella sp. LMS18 TaxID=2924033 RepID=UPI0020D1DE37|nr:hypothetical protein [Evansella sp. LMS18]UTR12476.1 hypothetical protein MM300_09400 [Evansella sp. LMS18]
MFFMREITDDNIPIGSTNNPWVMNNPPRIEGSIYNMKKSVSKTDSEIKAAFYHLKGSWVQHYYSVSL